MTSRHFFVCNKEVRNCRNNQCRGILNHRWERGKMELCYMKYQKDRSDWDDWG